jgi:hypothetical protein
MRTWAAPRADAPVLRRGAVVQAYRNAGGIVSGDALAVELRRHSEQPLSLLARWIVDREVISVDWSARTWLPLFQFDLRYFIVPGVRDVVAELVPVFDEWELAEWFVTANCWLDGALPLDTVRTDLAAVLAAARTDRFVAAGN